MSLVFALPALSWKGMIGRLAIFLNSQLLQDVPHCCILVVLVFTSCRHTYRAHLTGPRQGVAVAGQKRHSCTPVSTAVPRPNLQARRRFPPQEWPCTGMD